MENTALVSSDWVCPHCKNECSIPNNFANGELVCPSCSNTFYIEKHFRFIRTFLKAVFASTAIICVLIAVFLAIYHSNSGDYEGYGGEGWNFVRNCLFVVFLSPIVFFIAWMISSNLVQRHFKNRIALPKNPSSVPIQKEIRFSLMSEKWDKKHPNFPWSAIGGIAIIVSVLCTHWTGVTRFIGSTANSIKSTLVSSSIKGCIYVTTRNGNAVKMSGIQVFALDETALRKRIQEINGTIQSDYKSSLDKAGVKPEDTWFLEEKASWEAGLENDKIINSGTVGFYTTTTDADGYYAFPQVKVGSYCIIARGTREIGKETEYHLWKRTTTAQAGDFKIDLENTCDELNGNSFIESIDQNGLSQKIANQAKQGVSDGYWASIMINNYGLNLPVIYR